MLQLKSTYAEKAEDTGLKLNIALTPRSLEHVQTSSAGIPKCKERGNSRPSFLLFLVTI
jgi:hypothetical protein